MTSLWSNSFCLPYHSNKKPNSPYCIVLKITYVIVVVTNVYNNQSNHSKQDRENCPHANTPKSHSRGVKCESRHRANIEMCKLQPHKEKRSTPNEEIVIEDFDGTVCDTLQFLPKIIHLSKIIEPCDRVHQQYKLIISLIVIDCFQRKRIIAIIHRLLQVNNRS